MYRSHNSRWFAVLATCIAAVLVAGCAATPQLITTYPMAEATRVPVAQYPPAPGVLVVYNAYLEIDVSDVDAVAERVKQIAYDRGGYLVNAQAWLAADRKYATVTLAVPVAQFEPARQALRGLGSVARDTVSGDWVNAGPGANEWNTYSQITVHLRGPAPRVPPPALPATGWSPLRTFESAFSVVATVFQFVIDVAIWVVVVLGPFVAIALGARALVRRWVRK